MQIVGFPMRRLNYYTRCYPDDKSNYNVQLYFFLTYFKLINYLKAFGPNQHQNDSKIFVCYQIRNFSAHAGEQARGYKMLFSVSRRKSRADFHRSSLKMVGLHTYGISATT